jgi:5-methylcytosine-specific restriction enzyme A
MDFVKGHRYSRPEVKTRAGLAAGAVGGDWDTGIVDHKGEFVIFTNVGTEGRTGHDYDNRWEDGQLRWYHKNGSQLSWPSVQRLLRKGQRIHLFFRTDNAKPFTYAGLATPEQIADTSPVEVRWRFDSTAAEATIINPEEIRGEGFVEGAVHQVKVNAYERSKSAREECIAYFGHACQACGFDFEQKYGTLGEDFIHVHHLKQLSQIGEQYVVDPITDLLPVCANCHAMLHRRRPGLTIAELRGLLEQQSAPKVIAK